jgi:hypothetical protein
MSRKIELHKSEGKRHGQLAEDAAASLNLSGYVTDRIAAARRETQIARREVEAIKAESEKAA